MPYCPNRDCPHRLRTGSPADFRDDIQHCSDCGATLVEQEPIDTSLQEEAPSGPIEWTLLTHFGQAHEAHLAQSVLESESIPIYIADEYVNRMAPLYASALGGVRLFVPTADVDTALQLLSKDFSDEIDQLFDPDLGESEANAESERMAVRDQHGLQVEAGMSFSPRRPRLEGPGWIFWIGMGLLGFFLVWRTL